MCVTKLGFMVFWVACASVCFSVLDFGTESNLRSLLNLNFSYVCLVIPVQVFKEERCIFI